MITAPTNTNNQIQGLVCYQPLTMSSREIAELLQANHEKTRQAIKYLASRGLIDHPTKEKIRVSLGHSVKEYRVGKRDSFVIVSILCPEFIGVLFDWWQEREP